MKSKGTARRDRTVVKPRYHYQEQGYSKRRSKGRWVCKVYCAIAD